MEGTYPSGTPFGPYEIVSLLGRNLWEVYRARDPRQGRDVALKVFLPSALDVACVEEKRRELEREAQITKALDNHPNMLGVYDVGTWNGRLFVAIELLEGRMLRGQIEGKPLSVATSLSYALQIARVLAVAHERGIMHGNLKPSNVFIALDDTVKVLGFGEQSLRAPALAHPGYMAPELILGEEWDYRADIFAFGAILYEMLAGTSPFGRESLVETLHATLQDEPQPLREMNPLVPPRLERLVQRCLAKDRADRFQSTQDLVFELETLRSSG